MKSKAIFLLVIFMLNTLVGFGCALGMEASHHEDKDQHDHVHHHEHQTNAVSGLRFSNEDLCCKVLVNDLLIQSKLVPEISKLQVLMPMVLVSDYAYGLFIPVSAIELHQHRDVNHRERPPNSDIRTIIQSFQI